MFALSQLDTCTITINTHFHSHEVQNILVHSSTRILIYAPNFKKINFTKIIHNIDTPKLEHMLKLPLNKLLRKPTADTNHDNNTTMIFTSSNTTNAPKLIMHTQHNLTAHAKTITTSFNYRDEDTIVNAFLPLCNMFSFCTTLNALATNTKLVFTPTFNNTTELIKHERITHTNLSNKMLQQLLKTPKKLTTMHKTNFATFNLKPQPLINATPFTTYQCYNASKIQTLITHTPTNAPPK